MMWLPKNYLIEQIKNVIRLLCRHWLWRISEWCMVLDRICEMSIIDLLIIDKYTWSLIDPVRYNNRVNTFIPFPSSLSYSFNGVSVSILFYFGTIPESFGLNPPSQNWRWESKDPDPIRCFLDSQDFV